jgi:phospho-N-acetylmuramoyl-pentapeptide-transferase
MGMVNFIPVVIIITAVSNGANLTDGIDGFAAGTSAYLCWQEFLLSFWLSRIFNIV